MRETRFLLLSMLFLVLCFSELRGQFTLVYPRYPADRPLDVIFTDSITGYFTTGAGSIFRTTDRGSTWKLNAHYQRDPISSIKFLDSSLGFASSPYTGLWHDKVGCLISTNGGVWWSSAEVNLADAEDFLPVSKSIILKTNDNGIQRLDNFFGQWTTTYSMPLRHYSDTWGPYGSVNQLTTRPGGDIIAIVSFQNAFRASIITDSVSLFLSSSDGGASWATVWRGTKLVLRTAAFATEAIGWMGGQLESLFKTSNGGLSWTQQHLDTLSTSSIRKIIAFDTSNVVAVTGSGALFRTSDGGITWKRTDIEMTWETNTTIAFPTRAVGFYAGTELYRTLDGGSTWQPVNDRIRATATHLKFLTRTLGFVTTDQGFYASSDGGSSWSLRNNFTSNPAIAHFDFLDSLTGWATGHSSLMKTTDGGRSWTTVTLEPNTESVRGVQFCNQSLGVVFEVRENGSNYASLLVTSNGGTTWTKRTITMREFVTSWLKMKFTDPEHLWFANQQGLWLSRDTARTWQMFDSVTAFDSGFDMADSLRGFCDDGHYALGFTSDGGRTWTRTEKPFPNQTMDIEIVDPRVSWIPHALLAGYDGVLFDYEYGFGIREMPTYTVDLLRRISIVRTGNIADVWVLGSKFQILHNSYMITDVPPAVSEVPSEFRLEQNYPNPFNPTTTIRFTVGGVEGRAVGRQQSAVSQTRLVVYDLLGREVATLLDGQKEAGRYEVTFDGTGLASGVYVCRLSAGEYVESKKMLLIR
jgi:photosystem II stability/assembly factor-like uncharacterized protein